MDTFAIVEDPSDESRNTLRFAETYNANMDPVSLTEFVAHLRETHQMALLFHDDSARLVNQRASTVCVGRSGAGKSQWATNTIALFPGPCVVTATRGDLMEDSLNARMAVSQLGSNPGRLLLIDPGNSIARLEPGVTRCQLDLLEGCTDIDEARRTAESICAALEKPDGSDQHWLDKAGSLLTTVLFTAAVTRQFEENDGKKVFRLQKFYNAFEMAASMDLDPLPEVERQLYERLLSRRQDEAKEDGLGVPKTLTDDDIEKVHRKALQDLSQTDPIVRALLGYGQVLETERQARKQILAENPAVSPEDKVEMQKLVIALRGLSETLSNEIDSWTSSVYGKTMGPNERASIFSFMKRAINPFFRNDQSPAINAGKFVETMGTLYIVATDQDKKRLAPYISLGIDRVARAQDQLSQRRAKALGIKKRDCPNLAIVVDEGGSTNGAIIRDPETFINNSGGNNVTAILIAHGHPQIKAETARSATNTIWFSGSGGKEEAKLVSEATPKLRREHRYVEIEKLPPGRRDASGRLYADAERLKAEAESRYVLREFFESRQASAGEADWLALSFINGTRATPELVSALGRQGILKNPLTSRLRDGIATRPTPNINGDLQHHVDPNEALACELEHYTQTKWERFEIPSFSAENINEPGEDRVFVSGANGYGIVSSIPNYRLAWVQEMFDNHALSLGAQSQSSPPAPGLSL